MENGEAEASPRYKVSRRSGKVSVRPHATSSAPIRERQVRKGWSGLARNVAFAAALPVPVKTDARLAVEEVRLG